MKEVAFLSGMRERVKKSEPAVSLVGYDVEESLPDTSMNSFKKTFFTSVFAHTTAVLLMLIVPQVMTLLGVKPSYEEKFQRKDFKNAIRVDMVGLPTKKLIELQKIDPTEAVGKTVKEEAKPVPSETAMTLPDEKKKAEEVSKAAAETKAKAAAAAKKKRLDELRASMKVEQRRKELLKELDDGQVADTGRDVLAGNIVSQGYSVTGDVANDMDVYQGHLKVHIRKSWNLPGWMQASNLSAKVLVKFAPNGRIISQEFLKKSGNGEFDGHVMQAIKEAEPFPTPPPSLHREVLEEGVELGYPQ